MSKSEFAMLAALILAAPHLPSWYGALLAVVVLVGLWVSGK